MKRGFAALKKQRNQWWKIVGFLGFVEIDFSVKNL
jgi:hypothetical protein